MIPNGYLIFEDESFLDSTVAKMNALRKSGQFCDVRLQVNQTSTQILPIHDSQAIKWILWRHNSGYNDKHLCSQYNGQAKYY